jgi:hypothetical protein
MTLLATLTDPVVLSAAAQPRVLADGIIDTLNSQTSQLTVLFKNVIALAILIAFFYVAHKARFATGAIIGGVIMCGLIFFAVNGGLQWVGDQFQTQFNASAPVTSSQSL